VAVSSHCPGGGAAAARACRLCGVRRACRAQVRPGARVIPGALDLRRSPKAMGLGAQGSSAGPQGHGPRQGPWISRARTMAPVGPHDHVANEVRLRGRRTDAHLSPTTVLYPQFVRGIPARQTRQSERGRARTESLCPRFGCLFAVGFTRYRSSSCLLVCTWSQSPRGPSRRRSPRVRALRSPYRPARRAALWSVLAPAVPRRGVESDSPVARRLWARPRGLKPRLPRPRRETRININITRRKTRETESETRYQCGTIHERRNGSTRAERRHVYDIVRFKLFKMSSYRENHMELRYSRT